VKKVQFDATAGLIYSLGSSILHLAMFVATFVVKSSDKEAAKRFDAEYRTQIIELDTDFDYSKTPFN
jgi:hypothetical protein